MTDTIRATADFRRIEALPRREPEIDDWLVDELTRLLRSDEGCPGEPDDKGLCARCERETGIAVPLRLRPLQALALHDIGICGGAFLPLDVGEGKTLISLSAAHVLRSVRPLLLTTGALVRKTGIERDALLRHWRIPRHVCLMSYQGLGRVEAAAEIAVYAPDLIIADESHKLKNADAAVTRRVSKWLDAHPETRVVAMTGTIMRKSLRDFGHILRWCLKAGAPVPLDDEELGAWADALDETIENEFQRPDPGALLRLVTPEDAHDDPVIAARRAFRRRLRETPGVVASAPTGTRVDVGLTIRALRYDLRPETAALFRKLRDDMLTPDDWQLWQPVDVWRHAKELALGFHQIWDPRPPEPWRAARKAWFAYVREVLAHSRTYDSPEHVAQGLDAGKLSDKGRAILAAWRAIRDTFEPNPVPVWHDDSAVAAALEWMQQGPGIVWTEHVPFAEALARVSGATYYGAKGLSSDGRFVDHASGDDCVIVSVDANREGRNLQRKWYRNLITSPEEGADKWQQLLGRTHRPGQTREVSVDVFLGCAEHARAFARATASARSIRDTVGAESKLLIARVEWPDEDEIASWSGPRWAR